MASEARIGWGGEVHLSTDGTTTALVELVEVTSFGLPDEDVDEVEVTHLKSPNRRKEFIAGLSDGGEVEVSLNYVPGSATDELIRAAKAAGDTRAIRFVIPDQSGAPEWQIDTFAFVKGYARGPVSAGDKIDSTVRFRITGAQTEATVTP
jgi:hypothetical protein